MLVNGIIIVIKKIKIVLKILKAGFSCRKPKTQQGKRFLEKREPKLVENDKQAMFIKGGNTSSVVSQALKELVSL